MITILLAITALLCLSQRRSIVFVSASAYCCQTRLGEHAEATAIGHRARRLISASGYIEHNSAPAAFSISPPPLLLRFFCKSAIDISVVVFCRAPGEMPAGLENRDLVFARRDMPPSPSGTCRTRRRGGAATEGAPGTQCRFRRPGAALLRLPSTEVRTTPGTEERRRGRGRGPNPLFSPRLQGGREEVVGAPYALLSYA